eukprot:Em0013g403a
MATQQMPRVPAHFAASSGTQQQQQQQILQPPSPNASTSRPMPPTPSGVMGATHPSSLLPIPQGVPTSGGPSSLQQAGPAGGHWFPPHGVSPNAPPSQQQPGAAPSHPPGLQPQQPPGGGLPTHSPQPQHSPQLALGIPPLHSPQGAGPAGLHPLQVAMTMPPMQQSKGVSLPPQGMLPLQNMVTSPHAMGPPHALGLLHGMPSPGGIPLPPHQMSPLHSPAVAGGQMGPGGSQPLLRLPPPGAASNAQTPVAPMGINPANQTEVWFEHRTADGRVYFSHPQTQKTTWDRPHGAQIIPQPTVAPNTSAGASVVAHSPLPMVGGAPQLVPARVWSEHQMPDSRIYYYNKVTRQSVWEKPKDFELVMPLPLNLAAIVGMESTDAQQPEQLAQATQLQAPTSAAQSNSSDVAKDQEAMVVGDHGDEDEEEEMDGEKEEEEKDEGVLRRTDSFNEGEQKAKGALLTQPSYLLLQPTLEQAVQTKETPPPPPPPAPPAETKPEPPRGPHPIASVAITGTPWCVVWTSDQKMFYFNAVKRLSMWSMPEELEDNPQVTKVIDEPPWGKKETGDGESIPPLKKPRLDDNSDEEQGMDGMNATSLERLPGQEEAAEMELKAAKLRAGKSLEQRQEEFKQMLLERGVSAFSTWDKELPKFVFDPRYMLLGVKDRKVCFEDFIRTRAEEERKEKRNKLREKKDAFKRLLEDARLTPKSLFSDFVVKYGKHETFKGIEKMRERETLFNEHLEELKLSRKSKEEQLKQAARGRTEKLKNDFVELLREQKTLSVRSQWKKVKGAIADDSRYKAVESSSLREDYFKEYVKTLTDTSYEPAAADMEERDRQERIQASLREREREVMMSRTAQEKEWDREREELRKSEAAQHFKALLVDMVRNADATWHDTKKNLRKDHRWELTELIDDHEREKLFRSHVNNLLERKRLQFRRLMEETSQITLTMPWKKARKLIKEDPRYKNFGDSDERREAEYDYYLREKMVAAKEDFKKLLLETKQITFRTRALVQESEKHYKDVIDVLKNDKRYLILECEEEEREKILENYLVELEEKGPPPPPTATNPSDRLKRP